MLQLPSYGTRRHGGVSSKKNDEVASCLLRRRRRSRKLHTVHLSPRRCLITLRTARLLAGTFLLAGLATVGAPAVAQDKKENLAVKAAPREGTWMKRHEGFG